MSVESSVNIASPFVGIVASITFFTAFAIPTTAQVVRPASSQVDESKFRISDQASQAVDQGDSGTEVRPSSYQDPVLTAPTPRNSNAVPGSAFPNSAVPTVPNAGITTNSGQSNSTTTNAAPNADQLNRALLGGVTATKSLSKERRAKSQGPGTDAVLGVESLFRKTTDTGNLVGKSISVRGVSTQQRTPIVTDTRVRGQRVGQVLAAGSFWAPVRMDLDTMMNKIDSRLIDSLLIIKGPYSPRYGPGFSFVDIEMLTTPRYENGFESHGSTSVDYLTNGEQLSGRQTFFGGSEDWGYRLSYGHRTGNDYKTGAGTSIPSSYNSRDVNFALGMDVTDEKRIEFNYLRLDQTGVEFPGLVFDTRYLVTDGFEIKYHNEAPWLADFHTSEVWYNRTRFEGDTFGAAKNKQIPQLREFLFSFDGISGTGITDGDGSSFGYRSEHIFGDVGVDHIAFGTDMIYLKQGINDIEDQFDPDFNNFPLLPSESIDLGLYVERTNQVSDSIKIQTGARVDTIEVTADDQNIPGFFGGTLFPELLDQTFVTWLAYINAEASLSEGLTGKIGFGIGQRPPTLTEMYTQGTFIGTLQRGLTFLNGDPTLDPETTRQVDIGLTGDYERAKLGVNYFHAWISDFITYDSFDAATGAQGLPAGAGFVNTDRAVMSGVEAYGQYELLPQIDVFGGLSYVRGDDRSRDKANYFDDFTYDRSGVAGVPVEPLPGIPPLDTRMGISFHEASDNPNWGMELSVRAVARQNRIASTLGEVATPSFTTIDLRAFRTIAERIILTGGIENLTDRFYQEHLDYRSGRGVFRPGIGFYTGVEMKY